MEAVIAETRIDRGGRWILELKEEGKTRGDKTAIYVSICVYGEWGRKDSRFKFKRKPVHMLARVMGERK
jgi:hypothetical protein